MSGIMMREKGGGGWRDETAAASTDPLWMLFMTACIVVAQKKRRPGAQEHVTASLLTTQSQASTSTIPHNVPSTATGRSTHRIAKRAGKMGNLRYSEQQVRAEAELLL